MNAITTSRASAVSSPLMDIETFDHMQRVAKVLALSPLFPEHLRKGSQEQAIANGILVMNMAIRLQEDPLTISQNVFFVGGRPSWSTSYCISKANQHGVFKSPIEWEVKGSGDSLSVTAFAEMATSGRRVSSTCDMQMAKDEGWTRNPKYKSMPEHMLRFRSAAFLIRLYCPEVMVGIPAQAEIEMPDSQMRDITPQEPVERERGSVAAPRQAAKSAADDLMAREEAAAAQRRADEAGKAEKEAEEKAQLQRVYEDEAGTAPDGRWSVQRLEQEIAAVRKRRDDQPRYEHAGGGYGEDVQAVEPASGAPDEAAFSGLYDSIINCLVDREPVETIRKHYADQIATMAKHFPDMHADLEQAFRDAEHGAE